MTKIVCRRADKSTWKPLVDFLVSSLRDGTLNQAKSLSADTVHEKCRRRSRAQIHCYDYPSELVGGIDDANAIILFIESRIQTAQIKLYYLKAGTYIQRSSVVL